MQTKKVATIMMLSLILVGVMAMTFNARPAKADGIPGDVNDDGKVNGIDIVLVAKCWGSVQGDGKYKAEYDLNGDGKIDGKDLAEVAKYFGTHA